jgi:small subunit ribosomal protein S4
MRYTGPKWRINRRESYTVLGSSEKWRKHSSLPGQFPVLKKRPSEYNTQLREKQKVKRLYGLTEKQFRRFFNLAVNKKGNTGLILLQLLESRLDNVVYRLGFATTRAQARQFVNHGFVTLNSKKNDIPSTIVKVGDTIELKDKILSSPTMTLIKSNIKNELVIPWLKPLVKGGVILSLPQREDIDMDINERLIIELYSR